MAENIIGSYQHVKSEQFEDYLAAMNISLVPRKIMANTNPSVEITKEGDTWSITFKVLMQTKTIQFEVDKEFSDSSPFGGESVKVPKNLNQKNLLNIIFSSASQP